MTGSTWHAQRNLWARRIEKERRRVCERVSRFEFVYIYICILFCLKTYRSSKSIHWMDLEQVNGLSNVLGGGGALGTDCGGYLLFDGGYWVDFGYGWEYLLEICDLPIRARRDNPNRRPVRRQLMPNAVACVYCDCCYHPHCNRSLSWGSASVEGNVIKKSCQEIERERWR